MKRSCEIIEENGILKISGNPQESVLYLKGEPLQYSWFAEIGTTWRYHIAKGITDKSIGENQKIQDLSRRGIKNETDFLWITDYFKKFLCRGKYDFGYFELFDDIYWVEIPENEVYKNFDYYGGCFDLSPTQNNFQSELIDQYTKEILAGSRPVMILIHLAHSLMFFILDGHHKFLAYQKAKIKPHAIIITKLESKYMSSVDSIQLMKSMGCEQDAYLESIKAKKRYQGRKVDLNKLFKLILA